MLEFDFFFRQLKMGQFIDETCFFFRDDKNKEEHCIGYLPQFKKPYWVGLCDIENDCEFETAEELVDAKIFGGRSLRERWNEVVIFQIEGLCLESWLDNRNCS